MVLRDAERRGRHSPTITQDNGAGTQRVVPSVKTSTDRGRTQTGHKEILNAISRPDFDAARNLYHNDYTCVGSDEVVPLTPRKGSQQ